MRMYFAIFSLLIAAAAMPATAHSVKDEKELNRLMGERERYFQPIDEPAPSFTLRTVEGETIRLADLRGQVVVLHFIYASCPDICPLHSERLAEVQSMVNDTPMKDLVRFVSITTDPVNDTPDIMRDYGPAHGLDPVNWSFLTKNSDQPENATRRLAEKFGHTFTKTEEGYQVHSVVTHVIDKEGRWRANFHGLRFAPVNLVAFLNELVNDHHLPGRNDEPAFWERLKGLF